MPELPDIEMYREALESRAVGSRIDGVLLRSPFVLRSVDPPIDAVDGRTVIGVERLGKRVVFGLDDKLFIVIHLMIAGRFRWYGAGEKAGLPGKIEQTRLKFSTGTLILTEASQKKRASLHVVRGREALVAHNAGGIEPLGCTRDEFASALTRENHTIKRALTDPKLIAGIGNAYSDEILHAARLSPIKLTSQFTDPDWTTLYEATRRVLRHWVGVLRNEFVVSGKFPGPGDVTAFRPDFAVHGKFGRPCPVCAHLVQRIVRAESEVNYCPVCQTGGKVLADRSLSRLLKDDWPRTVEEWEAQ